MGNTQGSRGFIYIGLTGKLKYRYGVPLCDVLVHTHKNVTKRTSSTRERPSQVAEITL